MDDLKTHGDHIDGENSDGSRWVPVAVAFLAVASVAAEIWGVVRGLSVMIAR